MTKITDMLDQEVQIGDRIACAFRTYYGTAPQLRVGTVVDIWQRKVSGRTGTSRVPEDHLRVVWDYSSDIAEQVILMDDLKASRAARGRATPHAIDPKYRERTTDILVKLKRFIKLG